MVLTTMSATPGFRSAIMGRVAAIVVGGPPTKIFNIKRGSACCRVAVHRPFNGHERVPNSIRFSQGNPQ